MVAEEAEYRNLGRLAEAVQQDLGKRIAAALDKLADPYLVRARIDGTRIKSLASVRRKAHQHRWSFHEAMSKAWDIVCFRVVCNNLQDIDRAADLLHNSLARDGLDVKLLNYLDNPQKSGYRAIHLIARVPVTLGTNSQDIHCEIQIRSLVQNAWAELSRADIYTSETHIPVSLLAKMERLSRYLARADKTADDIRKEIARPRRGRRPAAGARLSDSAIAFIFERAFRKQPPDYLIQLVRRDFEGIPIRSDAVESALRDGDVRRDLASAFRETGDSDPDEVAVFTCVVHSLAYGRRSAIGLARKLGYRRPLEKAIEALTPGLRIVFVLHDIEGYDHHEIAEIMGCSSGQSRTLLHKARFALREVLDKGRVLGVFATSQLPRN